MSYNRFDLDVSYHYHCLNKLFRDIDTYTPFEYARALLRLVNVTAPEVMNEPEFCKNRADPNEQSKTELTGEYHADCNKLIKDLANEQSKIERIRAEVESVYLKLVKRRNSLKIGTKDHADLMNIEFGLRKSFEIIDRISNENDVPVIGGDS